MKAAGLSLAAALALGLAPGAAHGFSDEAAVRSYFEREDRRLLIGAGVARAPLYWHELEPIARAHGVPPATFFAVALAESQFNPHAVSPTGAEGMWQFTPATGLDYGVPDRGSRFDPVRSAGAAARYLVRLEQRFGAWDLAVAAYNLGPTALAATLRRTGAGSWTALRPHVRAETRDYVPKIEWLAREVFPLFESGEANDWGVRVVRAERGDTWFGLANRFGADLAEVRMLNRGDLRVGTPVALPPVRRWIEEGQSLASLARSAGLDPAEVVRCNPAVVGAPGELVRIPVAPALRGVGMP